MSETAPVYELPPADAELDALLGVAVVADAEDDALPYGGIAEAVVVAIDDENVTLSANGAMVRVSIADAKDQSADLPALDSKQRVFIQGQLPDGVWQGSLDKVRQLDRFEALKEKAAVKTPVEATLLVVRRSGFAVDVDGFRAFLPSDESGYTRDQVFDALGDRVEVEITGLDEKNLELKVSRKNFVEQERAQAFGQVATKLKIKDIVEGTVTSVTRFGAFVDINGVEGLLHISEMSLERVDERRMPVKVGDRLRVQVVRIDEERQRLGLSRKEVLMAEQFGRLKQLKPNTLVEGTVSGLTDFGAFVEFGDGFRGLCHVSELSWTERISKPADVLAVGQKHKFRILEIDPGEGRISLSLRHATANPFSEFMEQTPVGAQLDVRILEVQERGLVVAVNDTLRGFVRLGDLSWTIHAEKPSDVRAFEVDETLPAVLLQVGVQRQNILLGLKQMEPDPWDLAGDVTKVGHVFKAEVARFTENAAFLTVVPGLDARLHVAEISTERVESIRAVLRLGEEVEVMTTQADRARRRLDVSIKAIEVQRLANQPRAYAEESSMGAMAEALRASGLMQEEKQAQKAKTQVETAPSEPAPAEPVQVETAAEDAAPAEPAQVDSVSEETTKED